MHSIFIKESLKEARKAFNKGEVPIGCVVVKEGKIIARAHNLSESKSDSTAHAEILAIKKAGRKLGNWRLSGCTVYTTIKPCPMCSAALVQARVDKVIYGSKSEFIKLYSKNSKNYGKISGIKDQTVQNECSGLMKKFFESIRKNRG